MFGKYFKCISGRWKDKFFFVEGINDYDYDDEPQITMLEKYSEDCKDEFSLDDCEFVEVEPNWKEV